MRYRAHQNQRGFTYTELVVVCVILVILAGISFPIAKNVDQRRREADLSYALRTMRNAIDEWKRYCDAGLIGIENSVGTQCYPEDLELLVQPIDLVGQIDMKKRFLRRIPIDPMTGETGWEFRSHLDDWDSDFWGGESVFDVYSESLGVGLNGVPYAEW